MNVEIGIVHKRKFDFINSDEQSAIPTLIWLVWMCLTACVPLRISFPPPPDAIPPLSCSCKSCIYISPIKDSTCFFRFILFRHVFDFVSSLFHSHPPWLETARVARSLPALWKWAKRTQQMSRPKWKGKGCPAGRKEDELDMKEWTNCQVQEDLCESAQSVESLRQNLFVFRSEVFEQSGQQTGVRQFERRDGILQTISAQWEYCI